MSFFLFSVKPISSKPFNKQCFLKGKWKKKELIAVPSFNPLVEGSDVLKEKLLSPFLENIDDFEVYITSGEETYDFGFIKACI